MVKFMTMGRVQTVILVYSHAALDYLFLRLFDTYKNNDTAYECRNYVHISKAAEERIPGFLKFIP